MSEKVITIPNILTLLRIFLVPFFAHAMNLRDFSLALKILVVAGITDSLDGLIARRFRQISRLGTFLDPLADKILLITIMITFYFQELAPRWFIVVVFTRDILIALGWLECYINKKVVPKPMILGKIYNAAQVVVFSYVLLSINFNLPSLSNFLYGIVSLISIASFIQYVLRRLFGENEGS